VWSHGKTIEELIGKKLLRDSTWNARSDNGMPMWKSTENKEGLHQRIRRQGRHYLLVAYPIFDNVGEIVAFAHIIKDITVSKKAEEPWKRAKKDTGWLWRIPVTWFSQSMLMKYILNVSPAVKDMLGYDQSDLIGKPFIHWSTRRIGILWRRKLSKVTFVVIKQALRMNTVSAMPPENGAGLFLRVPGWLIPAVIYLLHWHRQRHHRA